MQVNKDRPRVIARVRTKKVRGGSRPYRPKSVRGIRDWPPYEKKVDREALETELHANDRSRRGRKRGGGGAGRSEEE